MEQVAFGPVPSRRLGRSLGVNNVPAKSCTYGCVYCQLGTYPTRYDRATFHDPEKVYEAVKKRVEQLRANGEGVDHITFVPDGEPTLDVNLGKEIAMLKSLGIPIAVLTNSSLLFMKEVREQLKGADVVSLKVDAASERLWRVVNRPDRHLDFAQVIEGMKEFAKEYRGELLTETMLVDGQDYLAEAQGLARLIAQLAPKKAYVAVPTRPPAESWVRPAREEQINAVFQALKQRLPDVELLIEEEEGSFGATGSAEDDLLSTLGVHPMREDEVLQLLQSDGTSYQLIDRLIDEKKVIRLSYAGKTFYMKSIPSRARTQGRPLSPFILPS